MTPLVSIITPSFNQGRFISATIESVLSQDYANIEYIVIDGGSTDDTLDILKNYSGRLTYISEKDEGQSDAINKGFKMAKGEIVAWLNSDDIYEPGAVSAAVKQMESNPNAALLYGEGYIIDENGVKLRRFEYTQKFCFWSLLYFQDYIMQPTTFFRTDALKKVGYLNKNLHWTMDWELWMKLAMKYDVLYTDEFLACSREYGATKTMTGGQKRLDEIRSLMQRFTNDENPYGYEIYDIAETLQSQYQDEVNREIYIRRLGMLLNNPPVPNEDGL